MAKGAKPKGKITKAAWERSSADAKVDKGRGKGWEGSKADTALDKKGMAKMMKGR